MKYRFYIYRDYLLPGPESIPEELVIFTDDPKTWAKEHAVGCIDRIDWTEEGNIKEIENDA